jgi:UDP-N-acetylmuramoyl-L-alanyl-D-glutamate--2,6-diaminopimelate ligase
MSVSDVSRGLPPREVVGPARPAVPVGPYLVMGTGNAGRSASAALAEISGPSDVVVCDDSVGTEIRRARRLLAKRGIGFAEDPIAELDRVGAVVKSPGIHMDHPVIVEAGRRGVPVMDELELGWRLARQPVAAVTGTDGKSTTAALAVSVLEAAGGDPLLSGNVEGFRHCPAMSGLPSEHVGWVVAEVSSYQAEGSPEFLPEAAVLTNLSTAHLGRHGSMARYAAAKRRLFVRGDRAVGVAVLNVDDELGQRLAAEVSERGGRTVTYGSEVEADLRILGCTSSLRSGTVAFEVYGESVEVKTRLPGAHNASNVAAAFALAEGLGFAREGTVRALATTTPVPGRFEPIDEGQPFDVVVDFAHTPVGVERTLGLARELVSERLGRTIAVMGKVGLGALPYQEAIGRACRAGANHMIMCGSSLRGEPHLSELPGIHGGARQVEGGELEIVIDRRKAMARALAIARPGDMVLILGRGGRRRMMYDTKGPPGVFDDRAVARELLRELEGRSR